MKEYDLKVSAQQTGLRLDQFIANFSKERQSGLSRTLIQKAIIKGRVTLGGNLITKPHYKVKEGEVFFVSIEENQPVTIKAEDIALKVVYEDKDLAVINKQAGLVVHPGAGNLTHTLANALLSHFKELSSVNPQRPGIVHRLDKETSGLLVIAKNNHTHFELSKQFAEHSIKRKYIAVVKGRLEFDENVIELPIGRHPEKRKNMSVGFGEKTKFAKTYYRTLKRSNGFSLLELEPFTGRTHQLRVHLAFIGHPIVGDTKYGRNNECVRMMLHAKSIGFIHPRTKEFVEFCSETPKEFNQYIKEK